MALLHPKNVVGVIQSGGGKEIPLLIKNYRLLGSNGTKPIDHKGNDIKRSLRSQGEIIIEFHGYFEKADANYMMMQAFVQSLPLTFSAIQLSLGAVLQYIHSDFLTPTNDVKGLLFRAFGFLDECNEIADTGDFIMIQGSLRASEFDWARSLL